MAPLIVRAEAPGDLAAIGRLITEAFSDAPHSGGGEAAIVDELRTAGALTLSLVADDGGVLAGHVAFSPVMIEGDNIGWFGLGPLCVRQRSRCCGVGHALVATGVRALEARGARGCVVLGDPAYYGRFGFGCDGELQLAGVPAEYFQRLVLSGAAPKGMVQYHPAFGAG